MKEYLFLVLFCSSTLCASNWALTDSSLGWNSRELVLLYYHNSDLQTQWAWQALSPYRFKETDRVLDFGCGDGKLTAMIASMVPKGKVTGIDISRQMIEYASGIYPGATYSNLEFVHAPDIDFSWDNQSIEKFDLVTSFCVFHLIPNPSKVLKNIYAKLAPHGKLVMTHPIGGNPDYFKAASEELAKRGWTFPSPTADSLAMRDPQKIRTIVSGAGFIIEHFQVVQTRNGFSSIEEMIDWFEGTLSANWNIPKEGRRQFFTDLAERYLTYRPDDRGQNGFVYFSLKRVDIVASPQAG